MNLKGKLKKHHSTIAIHGHPSRHWISDKTKPATDELEGLGTYRSGGSNLTETRYVGLVWIPPPSL